MYLNAQSNNKKFVYKLRRTFKGVKRETKIFNNKYTTYIITSKYASQYACAGGCGITLIWDITVRCSHNTWGTRNSRWYYSF